MSFFTKLKDRLFTSSSKLDAGIDAIVGEGEGEEQALPVDSAPDVPEAPEPPRPPETDPLGTPAPGEPPFPGPDEAPIPDPAEEPPLPGPDEMPPEPVDPEPVPPEAPEPPVTEPPQPPAPDQVPEVPDTPVPPGGPQAPVTPPGAAPVDDDPEETEENSPRLAQPIPMPVPEPEPEAPAARGGLMTRLFRRGGAAAEAPRRLMDDDMLEELEELLIASDMGVTTSQRVTANIAEGRIGRRLTSAEIKEALAGEIARIMEPVARPLPLYPSKPQVVLVVGVNGSGKTTTIGKLASQFRGAGKSVVVAAGDTFRAAAVEQLQIWGERAGVPVMTAPEGSDPASLAFDAMTRAKSEGADLLMIDTAGRLQNRQDLMEELAKIVRVIRKKDPDAPHNTLLVLDATTGQNALTQVEIFQKIADVSGLVMTKLDGTARGGVLVALADRFGLPIHAIGVGEQIDDLSPFDPDEFAAALVGTELEPA
ncbi:signal recognition particle-docking protein FtsY [Pseudoroseicyclus tamaricis]|uniref:Signal recognition particle receptor FtsY n=1 Tax=Pseudoroseicyclus tamaricis TaxID=2705421 RepID=A0A6B2JKD6_9RHOB|nr:signal recognition particle-docking protein FtsY [Pseudoroseicyclus tamaricis]NDV01951.1 signal recognition particle-docking protein FtsY [Pseudoroseicyclus tamaricis]